MGFSRCTVCSFGCVFFGVFGFVGATKELMDFCRDARIVVFLFPFLFLLCALSLVCCVCVVACCVVVLFLFVLFCFVFVMGLLCGTPAFFDRIPWTAPWPKPANCGASLISDRPGPQTNWTNPCPNKSCELRACRRSRPAGR